MVESFVCSNCGSEIDCYIRNCPTCQEDLGFPNVRHAKAEKDFLQKKYNTINSNLPSDELHYMKRLVTLIKKKSRVVVAVPGVKAKSFLMNKKELYINYETQVSSGGRVPASFNDDSHRCAVGGLLFGSYAHEINYGVLSISNESLANYGDVFFCLKNTSIKNRVSFLIDNSYHFVESHKILIGTSLPKGFRAFWDNKEQLVIIKLIDQIRPDFTELKCSECLVYQGADRASDRCVEAHIFGSFNRDSIESIKISRHVKVADKKILIKLAENYKIEVLK
jgi:hypothetical protein